MDYLLLKHPKPSKDHYGTWLGDKKEPTWREKLEQTIDDILNKKPIDIEAFIKLIEAENVELKRGKNVSLRMMGQKRFIRLRSLGDDYSEDAIRERIEGKRALAPEKL